MSSIQATLDKLMPPPTQPRQELPPEAHRKIIEMDSREVEGNPWRTASRAACIYEGSLRDIGGLIFPLRSIEFARPFTMVAGSKYRFRTLREEPVVVPAESLIMTQDQARRALAHVAGLLRAHNQSWGWGSPLLSGIFKRGTLLSSRRPSWLIRSPFGSPGPQTFSSL